MTQYIIVFFCATLVASISQILLKKAAEVQRGSFLADYLNRRVILAYTLFLISTTAAVYLYKVIPISMGPILETSSYFYIAVLSVIFLKERISRRKAIGLAIIICGIVVYAG